MAAPTLVNGDFAIPALAPGASVVGPTDPGVGWTWEPGIVSNTATIYGPGAAGWAGQYLVLRANNGSGIVSAAYQDLAFDGTACRLRFRAARLSGGRLLVTVGASTLIAEFSTGSWADWTEFVFEVTPTAGVHRVTLANRHTSGSNLAFADARIESLAPAAGPARPLTFARRSGGLYLG